MKKFGYRIAAALASAGVLATLMAPAAYADDLEISGNGDNSTNVINNSQTCTSQVSQSNSTGALIGVTASSSTGGNEASGNTGVGGVTIDTGDATTTVTPTVTGGSNLAIVPSCCECSGGPDTVLISGNGHGSTNVVNNTDTSTTQARQRTRTRAGIGVTAKAKTGKNKANNNTGGGPVNVTTGNATTTVTPTVTGGSNILP